jgi:ABC-type antimicrobial peptide transport system permease subunit
MLMLSWNISGWVLISAIIEIFPVWFFLNKWLEHYAYHISITAWVFLESALVAIIIAILTTMWHGYRCASINPVDALKHD